MQMKGLFFAEHGDATKLHYGEVALPQLKVGWSRIKVYAVALNHLDIWIRRGWKGLKLPLPHITGADICGEVVELGGKAERIVVGDRVTVYPGIIPQQDEFTHRGEPSLSPHFQVLGEHVWGGLAEYVDVPSENLFKVQASLSNEQAAAPNLVVTTVWRMLFARGRLQQGESVLVIGSGGGVNSLTIQICRALGCTVFVVAGGREKQERAYQLGATEVVDYTTCEQWHREILRLTDGRGVDLVVDNVGQATYQKSLKSLCRGGRLVTVGNTSGFDISIDNRLIFGKQLSIVGSTMGSVEDWRQGLQFLKEAKIEIPIDGVYPLSEGRYQVERMERGEHFGKIILIP
jgi:NADPH2:quinone reductase